ncbi:MAG TPA: alpha/beta hydrolase-fold protein [Planctomycetota bacterium]
MRARFLFAVLPLAAAATLVAQNPDRPRRDRREQAPAELENFTFKQESFKSEAVGRDMPYGVFLPKAYDDAANKDVKWPLIIWLHGMHEDHGRFADASAGAPVLDHCVGEGKLPACVFVTANGGRTSMYVNRKDQRWEDLITVDLLTHVEKTYRISEKREQRAIMGVSMGGMGALRIAFTKPDLFGAVGVHSSAVFAEDPEQLPERLKGYANRLGLDEVFGNPIQKEPWQKANPLCIAQALDPKSLHSLRIYFDAGTDDRYGFAAGNKLLDEALTKKGIEHTWRLIEGGGHSWGSGFQDQTLPFSLAVVGQMFAGKDSKGGKEAASDKGDAKGDKDPKKTAR